MSCACTLGDDGEAVTLNSNTHESRGTLLQEICIAHLWEGDKRELAQDGFVVIWRRTAERFIVP